MTKLKYQTDVYTPADRPYVYYPNPDNIQEERPQDIVKESEDTPNLNNEEHSDMIYAHCRAFYFIIDKRIW